MQIAGAPDRTVKSRILVVEDETIVARDIAAQLTSLGYAVVAQARTATEAIASVEALRPDLVLMDIRLGDDSDGIDAAQRIRGRFDLPVVFLTAFAEEETLRRAQQAEPFGYIIKPFDEQQLRTVVEMALYKHRVETRLRASEENYRNLVENSAFPVIASSLSDQRVVFANARAHEFLGYDRGSLVGVAVAEHWCDPAQRARMLAQFMEQGRVDRFVAQLRTLAGEPRWVELSVSKSTYEGQDCTFTVANDITDRRAAEEALRASENRFRTLFDNSPLGVLELDMSVVRRRLDEWQAAGITDLTAHWDQGHVKPGALLSEVRVIMANRRALEILRWDGMADAPPQLVGLTVPESWTPLRELAVGLMQGELLKRVAVPLVVPGGQVRWLDLTMAVQLGFETSLERVVVTFTDVTETRRAEIDARKLARAVEQSPVTVVITDLRGNIEYANPQFTRTSGYSLAEVIGRNPRVLKSGVQPESFYREMWATIGSGRDWHGEFCNRRKDGSIYWEDVSISPIYDETGRITNYLAVKEDITSRREADRHVQERAALLDVTQDAIFVLNLNREITYCNSSAERLYGVVAKEVAGRPFEGLVYKAVPASYEASWLELLAKGRAEVEAQHIGAGQQAIFVRQRASLLRNAAGQPHGALLVVTDISDARRNEAVLARAQRLESLGSLASGVAHDLNNVLTPIMVATDILKSFSDSPEQREVVQLVSDSARRGADVVQQLLLFGRGSDTPRSAVDVGAVLRDAERMIRETFPKNIVLQIHLPKGLWVVEADRTQLHQVVLNLSVNARDAMPAGGTLTLVAENVQVDEYLAKLNPGARVGPHVAIRTTDTGLGISPADLEKIFDPFFTTKPIGKGTGLGLATVMGIIRSHGGFITVDSALQRGTTFTAFIPAATIQEELSPERPEPMVFGGQGELVLLVDDEPIVRAMLERIMLGANYRVLVATQGVDALAMFSQHAGEVRLVITDLMMPLMDGPQLLHALWQLNPKLPAIAMSGLQSSVVELQKTFPGPLRLLTKPFTADDVRRVAREMLDAAAEAAASTNV